MQSSHAIIIAIACLLAGVVIGMVVIPVPDADPDDDAAMILLRLQSEISASLETLDTKLASAAYDLGSTGLDSRAARDILLEISSIHPAVIDCTTVSPEGIILAAEPFLHHDVEGVDVSDQKATQQILATRRPIMSGIIPVAEGGRCIVYQRSGLQQGRDRERAGWTVPRVYLHRVSTAPPDRGGG